MADGLYFEVLVVVMSLKEFPKNILEFFFLEKFLFKVKKKVKLCV